MALGIILIIMIIAGVIGGYANYLLPANSNATNGTRFRSAPECIALGIAATILVPLFLELAQSKLMEDIRFSFNWVSNDAAVKPKQAAGKDTVTITVTTELDSAKNKKTKSDTLFKPNKGPDQTSNNGTGGSGGPTDPGDLGKRYLLWAAYCMIAAAAGFRFIEMLINNVVKQQEIKTLKSENKELVEKKEKEEIQNRVNAVAAEKRENEKMLKSKIEIMSTTSEVQETTSLLPAIGPITDKTDPQKGRFGGRAIHNNRRLNADVTESTTPDFYNVKIWVESTDPVNYPLTSDVIFYIHDSFRPSVYTITPVDNRAEDDDILSYGAFTVGALTDNGETLLELDLATIESFPKKFRDQ